ncbi:hypothetical protein [Lichenicola sp.]|uniref:hypothetical protein n=1 Tax=Lichenicola sp. TaxID=2804529 RepID=UPI003AFFBE47
MAAGPAKAAGPEQVQLPAAEATIHVRAVAAQSEITAGPLQGPLAASIARDRAARCSYPVHHVVHRRRVAYRVAAVAPLPPPPAPPVPLVAVRPVYVYGPPVIYRPLPVPFVYRPFYRPYFYRPYSYRPFY